MLVVFHQAAVAYLIHINTFHLRKYNLFWRCNANKTFWNLNIIKSSALWWI